MDIKRIAEIFAGHGAAFDMPARPPFAPRGFPGDVSVEFVPRFPEREVGHGILRILVIADADAGALVLAVDLRKLAVIRKLVDEVVVVGYGVQKKSSVTGAISQVKNEDMQNRTITRPEQALQGKTAGVQIFQSSASPGASPTVRIRGINSNGSCDPLYVVDGRIASDIGGIDPVRNTGKVLEADGTA